MAHKREQYSVQLGARGRLVLPARVRKRLGLHDGDRMILMVQPDGSLRLASLRAELKKLQGIYAHIAPGKSLVDELIRERREEARREGEE